MPCPSCSSRSRGGACPSRRTLRGSVCLSLIWWWVSWRLWRLSDVFQNNDNFSSRRCLITSDMRSRNTVVKTSVIALLIAVLYRYWLVIPVLQYFSIGRWYLVALLVAAATGCVMSLLRLPTLALVCASVAGLLLGGTWAAWQAPTDVPISMSGAFVSHLGSFWRQIIILTIATVGGSCCARFARGRSPS